MLSCPGWLVTCIHTGNWRHSNLWWSQYDLSVVWQYGVRCEVK